MTRGSLAALLACGLAIVGYAAAEAGELSKAQAAEWLRWVIPLPKEIAIARKVELSASEVRVTLREGAGDVEKTAAQELASLFKDKADADVAEGRFEILIGVCDSTGKIAGVTIADAARLADLPNREQAYVIRPVGEDRLVLTALDERGVYYAAQTLRQLLDSKFADGNVTIPFVSVTDWPDLALRGVWGGYRWEEDEILWMAQHKLNCLVASGKMSLRTDGSCVAKVLVERLEFSRRHALSEVPIMVDHFNNIGGWGVFKVFPDLEGKRTARGSPCASNPRLVDVLAGGMSSLACQGVTEALGWLSEGPLHQCACAQCRKMGPHSQYVLEARALGKAWQKVRKEWSGFRLVVGLTQGSYPVNGKVLAELPKGVSVLYYHGSYTYVSSQEPMIPRMLEEFAAQGGGLGVVPQMTACYETVIPWTGPQFVKYRMTEFVDKRLRMVAGYFLPRLRLYDFNLIAEAEWSWNAHGRDPREFALAWATQRGFEDPEAVADWAFSVGQVGWDIHGADIPLQYLKRGKAAKMIVSRAKPGLGRGMFKHFPTYECFQEDLSACDKAMKIAERLRSAPLILETRITRGYVEMTKQIYDIALAAWSSKRLKRLPYDERVRLQDAIVKLALTAYEVASGLEEWERITPPDVSNNPRFLATVLSPIRAANQIMEATGPLGVRKFTLPFARKSVGEWSAADFKEKRRVIKKWDVTDAMSIPGTYEVTFRCGGHFPLKICRLGLIASQGDKDAEGTKLSADAHTGETGYHRSTRNTYTVRLDKREPGRRYFLVADIEGYPTTIVGGGRKRCRGDVLLRTVANDRGELHAVPKVAPLTDQELAQAMMPKFSGKGLRVGVIQGALSSPGLLAYLRTVAGIEAQTLIAPNKAVLEQCQVVIHMPIMPQPDGVSIPGTLVKDLHNFVRAGGGVISIHDAVGYRGQPLLVTGVCAKGVAHVRDAEWVVADREHPVTAGIEPDRSHLHSYYDHIELEAGPSGTVLAKSVKTGRPVVVAGAFGKGRYVACGILLGVAPDNSSIIPAGAEESLLENAVRWCAGQP